MVVRVSATAGLEPFEPGPSVSGSTAAALELVFDSASVHGAIERIDGRSVAIQVHENEDASVLASSLRFRGLEARTVDANRITATFDDEKSAVFVADLDYPIFDTGPFLLERQEPGRVRLVRRREHPIDVIEIVETSHQDEWRKLMGRELDVIPGAANAFRTELDDIDSIRVFDLPATADVALYFNVNDPSLRDVAVRRRLAAVIRREALARLACGDESCAAPPVEAREDVSLPSTLTLSIIESDATLMLAARALAYQLGELGIEIDVRPSSISALVARDFQMTIMPLVRGRFRFIGFVSSAGAPSVTGFADPNLDAAYAAGDMAGAQRILDERVPVTPLFEYRRFAAVDARLCGDVTPNGQSWRWIADLHPCEGAE